MNIEETERKLADLLKRSNELSGEWLRVESELKQLKLLYLKQLLGLVIPK